MEIKSPKTIEPPKFDNQHPIKVFRHEEEKEFVRELKENVLTNAAWNKSKPKKSQLSLHTL